jgi:hypothetical protein
LAGGASSHHSKEANSSMAGNSKDKLAWWQHFQGS